ncbi:glycosyltransferase family 4 protein [Telmatospirillum sp. J64-1]|uniref:glycosyltransferase family 4 protein n=1 Tax=Telmatospirillum sp. J64-1 TaxID=2502183 RepID=UPI00115EEACD|nr:glycosyltransferase family 4 protein [Telmatospirillum sp. J64-1]
MRLLYLSVGIPFPPRSGETRLRLCHLEELACQYEVTAVLVDVDGTGEAGLGYLRRLGVVCHSLPRPTPRAREGWRGKLALAAALAFSPWPWHGALATCSAHRRRVAEIVAVGKFDAILFDHMNALALADWDRLPGARIFYIAHDVAGKFHGDLARLTPFPESLIHRCEGLKAQRLERRIMARADEIFCLSPLDEGQFRSLYPQADVTLSQAFLPTENRRRWHFRPEPRLFFCGTPSFPPNREAIGWLAGKLAPELAVTMPEARIVVAGAGAADLPSSWRRFNMDYRGFVTREALVGLFTASSLFLCPVSYGSGVKIKLLEALSFGQPVLATAEAADGISFFPPQPRLHKADPAQAARQIVALLKDEEALCRLGREGAEALAAFERTNNRGRGFMGKP